MTTHLALTGELPAISQQVSWTWAATPYAPDLTRDAVADAYEAWGLTLPMADTTGVVAADYVVQVQRMSPAPYVTVTAALDGTRLAVIAAPALHQQGDELDIRFRAIPYLMSAEGRHPAPHGTAVYAVVNLVSPVAT